MSATASETTVAGEFARFCALVDAAEAAGLVDGDASFEELEIVLAGADVFALVALSKVEA